MERLKLRGYSKTKQSSRMLREGADKANNQSQQPQGSSRLTHRRRADSLPLPNTSSSQVVISRSGSNDAVTIEQRPFQLESNHTFYGLDPAIPRGQNPTAPILYVDRNELLQRVVDVENTSSIAFILDALQTVSEGKNFSENRRNKLKNFTTGTSKAYLVEQMGLRTAKSQVASGGFAPFHPSSTTYLRTGLDKLTILFDRLTIEGEGKGPTGDDYPVNSPKVLDRLKLLLTSEDFQNLTLKKAEEGNIYFLRVLNSTDLDLKKLLHDVGATPSPFQLYKLLNIEKGRVEADFEIDTHDKLTTFLESGSFKQIKQLAQESIDQKEMYGVIEHLLQGIKSQKMFTFDPLTNNVLDNIMRLARIAVASNLDPGILAVTIDFMMDELMVLFGARNQYFYGDFQNAVASLEDERSPALKKIIQQDGIKREFYYASSGMDAISTALTIALNSSGDSINRVTKKLDYFELVDLLNHLKRGNVVERGDVGIILAALHPSTPYDKQNIQELTQRIGEILDTSSTQKRLSLIVDTTIETGGPELNLLWQGLEKYIVGGKLNVFTAKSYHKYASLGTGKLSAGVMTLVGKEGRDLPDAQVVFHDLALDFDQYPEAQLMTHILTHAAGDEITLIQKAAKRAEFIDSFCWPPRDNRDSKYVEGIPLLFRAMGGQDVRPFVELLGIDKRDSFAFLRTAHVPIDLHDGCVRINPGQESEATMVEYFYALGHLIVGRAPGQDKSDGGELVISMDTIFNHLEKVLMLPTLSQDSLESRFAENIRASYLSLAGQLTNRNENLKEIPPFAVPQLRDELGKFINEGMIGVSRAMQIQLAAHYLDQCCLQWPDPKTKSGTEAEAEAKLEKATLLAARLVAPEHAKVIQGKMRNFRKSPTPHPSSSEQNSSSAPAQLPPPPPPLGNSQQAAPSQLSDKQKEVFLLLSKSAPLSASQFKERFEKNERI